MDKIIKTHLKNDQVETRWNSLYDSLQNIVQIKGKV